MIQPKRNWPIENRAIAAAVSYQSPLRNPKGNRDKEDLARQMQSESFDEGTGDTDDK